MNGVPRSEEAVFWIELGVVARPHGVDGEARIHVFNPESTLLRELAEVFLVGADDEEPSLVEIVSVRPGPKCLLMRFSGVLSRSDAEALKGSLLCVPREALPELEEGEFYHTDLIGLEAFEGGKPVGKVVEVLDYPSVECLRIERADGFVEVPMLPQWVERLDIAGGEVHLKQLDELPVERRR